MIRRAKLSAVRANSFVVAEQFTTFSQFWCHCLRIGGAALIRGRRLLTFLSQMRRLFEGGAYSSKYGMCLLLLLNFVSVLFLKAVVRSQRIFLLSNKLKISKLAEPLPRRSRRVCITFKNSPNPLSRILPTLLVFRWGYVNTEKVLNCLNIEYI